ncbi:hypothetical protein V5O48_010770 [Marasmius crinis-equi]|uniref:Major facilitator superfamily (MFS) profile domain-containing protein n=1 Tax=Marasmius crinis-equi TaxID=585013 RepID=A0ABR3F7F0_9AGAR
MVVLSIAMLGEFLSANVSAPFLLFMVKGFGKLTDEAEVAYWTGILVATFFLTQFVTSLLWATIADKHGRRLVLVISLLGSAFTTAIFGTATSLPQAMCIRLLQGIFAGAVGVARGSVAFVTDPTNEGRAYAILGFCWGLGGVAGAIIGGSFERPADKWPDVFGNLELFKDLPYLLPTSIAALIMLIGALLACFLGPDGGPREGTIRLPIEKYDVSPIPEEGEESAPPTPHFEPAQLPQQSPLRRVSQRISGYFGRAPPADMSPVVVGEQPPVALSSSPRTQRRFGGSAYGYGGGGGSFRNRLVSNATVASRMRRPSLASYRRRSTTSYYRRGSTAGGGEDGNGDIGFAQRLLMANENAVTSIADLWVAAAMNVDNEDPFEDSDGEEGEGEDGEEGEEGRGGDEEDTPRLGSGTSPISIRRGSNARQSVSVSGSPLASRRYGAQLAPRRPSNLLEAGPGSPGLSRRYSSGVQPAIFAHSGVKTPAAVLDAQQLLAARSDEAVDDSDPLEPIPESRRASTVVGEGEVGEEKPPSLASQIPVLVIMQYGLLALHSTTHDQVFMSYLVTDYNAGGLNLNAGHFAQLIALMCLAQIAYQFYLYPNLGPPRGRFSHLTMFRLGCLLFIPSYLTVVLYRVPFASEEEDGNFFLMTALAVSTAVRYCAITFAYTSISILLNYMTPPQAVGVANGIAQSIASLARCVGPVLGGLLWSMSIEGNPNGYPIGFLEYMEDAENNVLLSPVHRLCERCRMKTGAPDNISLLPDDSPFLRSNYAGQYREMADMMQQEEQELSLRRSLENLEARKRALETDIGRRRAVISAQRRVPTEVWEMIFSYCHEYFLEITDCVAVDHPRTISRVCWRWSGIVRNCPMLWSRSTLTLAPLASPRTIFVCICEIPEIIPLTIELFALYGGLATSIASGLRALLQHSSRWRMLILVGHHVPYLDPADIPSFSLPNLRFIILSAPYCAKTNAQKWFWQALHDAPSLVAARTFDLLPLLPYRQLTTLTIECYTGSPDDSNKLLAVLSACKKLRSLRLELEDRPRVSTGQPDPQPVEMPSLRFLLVSKKRLTIVDDSIDQFDILSTLFARLRTPALVRLNVYCEDTYLTLYIKKFGVADSQLPLLDLLEPIPSLIDFEFMMSRNADDGGFSEQPYGTLKTPSTSGSRFLSNLQFIDLCVNGVNLDAEAINDVLQVAASRTPTALAEVSYPMYPLTQFIFTRHPNEWQEGRKDAYEKSSFDPATLEALADLEREGVKVEFIDSQYALSLNVSYGFLALRGED